MDSMNQPPAPSTDAAPGGWVVRGADPASALELGRRLSVSASTAQVLLHRGHADELSARDFLDARLAGLTQPDAMADRALAVDRLARAVRQRERIAIFGDYDVDGTTSTSILADALEAMGGEVVTHVAQRFAGGYGLSAAGLERIRASGADLLVTCDCGSSDHERIADARRSGLEVIVVDHHLVPSEPLPAFAFLNPHRPDCGFPYKGLSSAGLALSLAAGVRAALGTAFDLRTLLDLVALGTIADVAPLDGDNRRLVRAGLARLGVPTRPGVTALRERAKMKGAAMGAIDVAFRLAPRLNAAGRLADPALTVALLRARTLDDARAAALCIEALNDDRKALTRRITEEAVAQAKEVYGGAMDGGLVVAAEGWHRGVVGIVAARLVELFGAPVLVLSLEDGMGHGSGRAPAGFPLHDATSRCRAELAGFGGHQAAVGLTAKASRIEALRAAFDDACRDLRGRGGAVRPPRLIDVALDGGTFGLPSASELSMLEPLGHGNAEPLFLVPGARVEEARTVGEGHLKLTLRVGGDRLRCFGWEMAEQRDRFGRDVTVVGSLRPDAWIGGEAVELRLIDVLPGTP